MKRVILDTNIYGLIAIDVERSKIREWLGTSGLVVYGSPVIRKQLNITKERELEAGKKVRETADAYYRVYKEIANKNSEVCWI